MPDLKQIHNSREFAVHQLYQALITIRALGLAQCHRDLLLAYHNTEINEDLDPGQHRIAEILEKVNELAPSMEG